MTPDDKKILTTIVERHALICALCLYKDSGGKAKTALTVIEGYAVCDDHLGYVAQGQNWASILRAVRRE
jgi:hypothetical protein